MLESENSTSSTSSKVSDDTDEPQRVKFFENYLLTSNSKYASICYDVFSVKGTARNLCYVHLVVATSMLSAAVAKYAVNGYSFPIFLGFSIPLSKSAMILTLLHGLKAQKRCHVLWNLSFYLMLATLVAIYSAFVIISYFGNHHPTQLLAASKYRIIILLLAACYEALLLFTVAILYWTYRYFCDRKDAEKEAQSIKCYVHKASKFESNKNQRNSSISLRAEYEPQRHFSAPEIKILRNSFSFGLLSHNEEAV